MIVDEFRKEFLYQNREGGVSIDKEVLKEFRKLTGDRVVHERSGYWRWRKPNDRPGRRQAE